MPKDTTKTKASRPSCSNSRPTREVVLPRAKNVLELYLGSRKHLLNDLPSDRRYAALKEMWAMEPSQIKDMWKERAGKERNEMLNALSIARSKLEPLTPAYLLAALAAEVDGWMGETSYSPHSTGDSPVVRNSPMDIPAEPSIWTPERIAHAVGLLQGSKECATNPEDPQRKCCDGDEEDPKGMDKDVNMDRQRHETVAANVPADVEGLFSHVWDIWAKAGGDAASFKTFLETQGNWDPAVSTASPIETAPISPRAGPSNLQVDKDVSSLEPSISSQVPTIGDLIEFIVKNGQGLTLYQLFNSVGDNTPLQGACEADPSLDITDLPVNSSLGRALVKEPSYNALCMD
ncbi:hypothetical protein H0H87_000461 [Tephrocybe sp. NHM501043]|nr:hypothetical protein H0H87_000461 [Tephrocybe sp. NHM501043]